MNMKQQQREWVCLLTKLAEYTGDCYVVIVMAQIIRRLVDAYLDEEATCDDSSLF